MNDKETIDMDALDVIRRQCRALQVTIGPRPPNVMETTFFPPELYVWIAHNEQRPEAIVVFKTEQLAKAWIAQLHPPHNTEWTIEPHFLHES